MSYASFLFSSIGFTRIQGRNPFLYFHFHLPRSSEETLASFHLFSHEESIYQTLNEIVSHKSFVVGSNLQNEGYWVEGFGKKGFSWEKIMYTISNFLFNISSLL